MLLPHIRDRAMVMRRYPNGAAGSQFFMKEAPTPRPVWIRTCAISHNGDKVVNFPVIDDLPSLLWVINLGCIDLNQWYARCDDYNRPDYVHFDLDPSEGTSFELVRECGLIVRDALESLGMKPYVKTTGSRGLHVYVPIVRDPTQDTVLTFAKTLATELASRNPKLMTLDYRVARRPRNRVLVDYKQNAWGQTLASIYSVRPKPLATVSVPLTWKEVEKRRAYRGLQTGQRAPANRQGRRSLEGASRQARPHRPRTLLRIVNLSDFDFELPEELIAQHPPAERGGSRLVVFDRATGQSQHTTFDRLPAYLSRGDLLVVNDTRVFPARLLGHRVPSGGAVECLLIRRLGVGALGDGRSEARGGNAEEWDALMHPGQKLKPGAQVRFERNGVYLVGEVLERHFFGRRSIRLESPSGESVADLIERIGHVPLPPYIKRDDDASDRDRYQTIYARRVRIGGGADGWPAFHAATARGAPVTRHRADHDHLARGIRDVQAGASGARRGP